jgi:RING-variant domain
MIVRLHEAHKPSRTYPFLDPPDPPPVWTHPCKCTLVAHESCLLHWIKTQQHEFGRTRGELKCPQCGDYYEFEGFNPPALRLLNSINRALSKCGRVITICCAGTVVLSLGAGESTSSPPPSPKKLNFYE